MKKLIPFVIITLTLFGCRHTTLQCSGQCSHKDTLLVIVKPYHELKTNNKFVPVDYLLVNNKITERTYEKSRNNAEIIEKILSQSKLLNN
jgi:hypothetical protein